MAGRVGTGIGVLCLAALIAGVPFGPAHAAMENYPIARLRMLDKVTARTSTFDARVDTTVKFGALYIKPRACRKAPPIETPESAAFLQIWEVTPRNESEWVFSGWMFASSPALSSMDHPIYDVWVLDCLSDAPEAADTEKAPDAAPDSAPADDATASGPKAGETEPAPVDVPIDQEGLESDGSVDDAGAANGVDPDAAYNPNAHAPSPVPQQPADQGANFFSDPVAPAPTRSGFGETPYREAPIVEQPSPDRQGIY